MVSFDNVVEVRHRKVPHNYCCQSVSVHSICYKVDKVIKLRDEIIAILLENLFGICYRSLNYYFRNLPLYYFQRFANILLLFSVS